MFALDSESIDSYSESSFTHRFLTMEEAGGQGLGLNWTRSEDFDTDIEVKEYVAENNLVGSKTNHSIGSRKTYLRCLFTGCPKKLRIVANLVEREGVPKFEIEEVLETIHNHQVEVPRDRGLSLHQKSVVDLCVERGQSAPKKVHYHLYRRRDCGLLSRKFSYCTVR